MMYNLDLFSLNDLIGVSFFFVCFFCESLFDSIDYTSTHTPYFCPSIVTFLFSLYISGLLGLEVGLVSMNVKQERERERKKGKDLNLLFPNEDMGFVSQHWRLIGLSGFRFFLSCCTLRISLFKKSRVTVVCI